MGLRVTLASFAHAAAYHEWNLDGLVELTWQYLDLLRIYTKPKVPLVLMKHGHALCEVQQDLCSCPPSAASCCSREPSLR